MRAYIYCPRCAKIHGCIEVINGKQTISICFKCRFKPIRKCDDCRITSELKQLCIDCIIDLAFINKS